jgi:dihydroorotase
MRFDVLVKGGHVVDPAQGIDGRADVAIRRDRIAACDHDIPAGSAARVIDASGQYVTPGLIDLHTHIFRGVGYFGIDAESIACRTGVTTWVDAGSAGAFSLPGFREFIVDTTPLHVLAFMNISYVGLSGLNNEEYCNLEACDVDLFRRVAEANHDIVVGVKTRMGTDALGYQGLEPLRRALQAADACGLPVMCHICMAPPPIEDVLALLRPGDIVTHSFTGASEKIVSDDGMLLDAASQARERGVIFDIGHGAGSFSFESAEALVAAGFLPDVISTDLHQISLPGPNLLEPEGGRDRVDVVARVKGDGSPAFTLLTAMSKFLHLGMSLTDVVRATTIRPAELLGMEDQIGTLQPGASADVALCTLDTGEFPLSDVHGNTRVAHQMLRNTRTILRGQDLPMRPIPPSPPWIRLVDRGQ